jgi:hypothetical protein
VCTATLVSIQGSFFIARRQAKQKIHSLFFDRKKGSEGKGLDAKYIY